MKCAVDGGRMEAQSSLCCIGRRDGRQRAAAQRPLVPVVLIVVGAAVDVVVQRGRRRRWWRWRRWPELSGVVDAAQALDVDVLVLVRRRDVRSIGRRLLHTDLR